MNAQTQALYIKSQVNTAHPGELTLMLYNGCLKFMAQAKYAISEKHYEDKNLYIQRCLDIIDELMITLNKNYDISKNLESLYIFMKENLVTANIKLSTEHLDISMNLMREIRDTWIEVLKQVKSNVKATI